MLLIVVVVADERTFYAGNGPLGYPQRVPASGLRPDVRAFPGRDRLDDRDLHPRAQAPRPRLQEGAHGAGTPGHRGGDDGTRCHQPTAHRPAGDRGHGDVHREYPQVHPDLESTRSRLNNRPSTTSRPGRTTVRSRSRQIL